MGEVIAAVLLVFIVIVAVVGGIMFLRSSSTQRNTLIKAPALLLPDGEPPDVLLRNAQNMHRLAERSARLLDRLGNNSNVLLTLSKSDKQELTDIVNTFYNH